MKSPGLLFAVSAGSALAYLLSRPITAGDWPVILKVLSILLLALLGFRVHTLLGMALAISSSGDFLLGVRRLGCRHEESLFLLGLSSFLIAHLFYIAQLGRYRAARWWNLSPMRLLGIIAILIALSSVLASVWHSLGSMLIPVVIYSLVLSCMGISAIFADLKTPWAALGALLFIVSDAMIAISKFRSAFPGSEQFIWISYYSAQCLILRGLACEESQTFRH